MVTILIVLCHILVRHTTIQCNIYICIYTFIMRLHRILMASHEQSSRYFITDIRKNAFKCILLIWDILCHVTLL